MKYDFDQVIDRRSTSAVKWDELESLYGNKDLIPMWVADMDFPCPQPVVKALTERAKHGIYGYTTKSVEYLDAVVQWMEKRHRWHIQREWICHSPSVVPAIAFIVNAFTNPGDKIIVQPPVYRPFSNVIEQNQREVTYNPLLFENGRYRMDFSSLRMLVQDGAKMLILCSPHNPVGRVWERGELAELGQICADHGVLVVSDEIHFDLVYKPHTHTPFASVSEVAAQNSIVCTAPSKTFNLAGLQTSNIIIPNPELRNTYNQFLERLGIKLGNTFGLHALQAAYKAGEEWLEQVLAYIQENLNFLAEFIAKEIPDLKVVQPEGTYLVWVDCRSLNMSAEELSEFMRTKALVAIDDGQIFGPGGEGFIRLNIACPRSVLEEGLNRIASAIRNR